MCGIGGVYNPSGREFPTVKAGSMWTDLSDRGTHASGVAWMWDNSDKPCVWKAGKSSTEAVREGVMNRVGKRVLYAFMHTRYTTQGSVKNNNNNHPVCRDDIILTHNGVIQDDPVFSHFNVNRKYQVDTEAVSVGLRHGGIGWVADNIEGSMSLAWVDCTKSTTTVNLFTNGRNPLVIARTDCGRVVWASNLYHIEENWNITSHFNATPFKHYRIEDDGSISSRFVSEQRAAPTVIGRYSYTPSWGSYSRSGEEHATPTYPKVKKTKGKRSTRKNKVKKSVRVDIQAGWVYDEELKAWRKAKPADYAEAEAADEWGWV